MNRTLTYYNRLSIIAFLLFVILIFIQVNWLRKAMVLQKQETHQRLKRLVPDIAMAINAIDHDLFHSDTVRLKNLDLDRVEFLIDSILQHHEIDIQLYFAIHQDTTDGIFKSNQIDHKSELIQSDIRSCISCIVSFSIAKPTERYPEESDSSFLKRLNQRSSFQYFSPVNDLVKKSGKTLWLSLYNPNSTSNTLRSLGYIFSISIVLIISLFGLFYYLIKLLTQHKKLSQAKDDFFNNMTHEFKTPLSSIRLASKVLRQNKNEEKKEVYHQLIEYQSDVLATQVDKLLQLSLWDNEGLNLDLRPVDLHEIITSLSNRLRVLIEENQANLQFDLNLNETILNGDFNHLSNSFCNLIENSIKYANKHVNVLISTSSRKGKKVIQIRDNGPGIPLRYQDQIFDRFFRGQKNNQYKGKGFGIGLSYVKSIIEAHNGTIRLNTAYTDGCEFIIEL